MLSILDDVDFGRVQLKNTRLHNLAAAPASPGILYGLDYYDTTSNTWLYWNGTIWVDPRLRSNHSGSQLSSTISDLAATVQGYRLDQFAAPAGTVSWSNQKLSNLANGTLAGDAAAFGQIPLLSSTAPAALGTAAIGVGATTARADHVHAMPNAAAVGALDLTGGSLTGSMSATGSITTTSFFNAPGSYPGITPGLLSLTNTSVTGTGVQINLSSVDSAGASSLPNLGSIGAIKLGAYTSGSGATYTGALVFGVATGPTVLEGMRLTSNKALLINQTTDDGINKLQVTGSGVVTGALGVNITPTYSLHALGGGVRVQALATAATPTISNTGATGAVSYWYWVVPLDRSGNQGTMSGAGTTATANATLSGTIFETITWLATPGAASYDVLRTTTATAPTGTATVKVGNTSALTLNDQSNTLTSYTVAVRNKTADVTADGLLTAGGLVAGVLEITAGASTTLTMNNSYVSVNKATSSNTGLVLPKSPVQGQNHSIKDGKGDSVSYPITITTSDGSLIDGATSFVIGGPGATPRAAFEVVYIGTQWCVF